MGALWDSITKTPEERARASYARVQAKQAAAQAEAEKKKKQQQQPGYTGFAIGKTIDAVRARNKTLKDI